MNQAETKAVFYSRQNEIIYSSRPEIYWDDFGDFESDTSRKIRSFADLPLGWDYGGGGPIDKRAIEEAINWEQFLTSWGFFETDAAPGGDGEISIAASCGVHYLELGLEPDHTITLIYEKEGQRQLYLPRLTQEEAHGRLLDIVGDVWSASAYTIGENTFLNLTGGQNMPSVMQRLTMPFQYLIWNVSKHAKSRSASI